MPRKRGETARTAITVAATGIGAAADLAAGGTGIIGGAAAGALLVFEAIWNRQKARGERMVRAAFDVPDEQFAEVIREKLEDERVRDALLESMRAALEAMSDEVMPALGGLVREYEREGRRADGFFRGCCRLLQDLSSEEYASFSAVIRCIAKASFHDRFTVMIRTVVGTEEWVQDAVDKPRHPGWVAVIGTGRWENPPKRNFAAIGCKPEHMPRLFHLLDREALARKRAEGRTEDIRYCEIDVAIAGRIAAILPA